MKKVIFDLDGTLLFNTFIEEKKYFESTLPKEVYINLKENIYNYLNIYETNNIRYDVGDLKRFLSSMIGFNFTDDFMQGWIEVGSYTDDTFDLGLVETLEDLKRRDAKLAVLTNWFRKPQEDRLKNSNIYGYFDEIFTGEEFLKPHKEAYINALGDERKCDCLFVGNHLEKDYIGPKAVGISSVLYDKDDIYHESIVKIKKMSELKRRVR